MKIIYLIEGIACGQESTKDKTVTKIIEELDTRCIGWVQSESNEVDFSWSLVRDNDWCWWGDRRKVF